MQQPISCIVLGATGYAGSELLALLDKQDHFKLVRAFNAENSQAIHWRSVAPQLAGSSELLIEPWSFDKIKTLDVKLAFLALPHEASAELAPQLAKLGIKVFDLSGAFRLKDQQTMQAYYGFNLVNFEAYQPVPYMLMPWLDRANFKVPDINIYAIPGCYPTVSLLALKPLVEQGLLAGKPCITAISGVSGAGKGAKSSTSFCEVSLQPYGVLKHRHQPEIAQSLGQAITFTPVLAAIKRGILAVCVVELNRALSSQDLQTCYEELYKMHPLVKLVKNPPAVDHVAGTPYCHIHIESKGQTAVITAAIDNLLMGAASQALQAANYVFDLPEYAGIISK